MFRILYFGHLDLFRVSYFVLRICYEIALQFFSACFPDATLANRFSHIGALKKFYVLMKNEIRTFPSTPSEELDREGRCRGDTWRRPSLIYLDVCFLNELFKLEQVHLLQFGG